MKTYQPDRKLPKTLYKYFRFDEFLYQHLIKNSLWFSTSEAFNDPYDCNICFEKKAAEQEKIVYKTQLDVEKYNKSKVKKWYGKRIAIPENEFISKIEEQVKVYGICCFSSLKDNLLMWAHYADAHRGVCIGYDTEELLKSFNNVDWIRYGKTFPIVNFSREKEEALVKIMRHKSIDWKYEKELRIISMPGANPFQRRAIKEIIFGLKTPKHQVEALLALVFQLNYEIPEIWKVAIKNNEYKIHYVPIAVVK